MFIGHQTGFGASGPFPSVGLGQSSVLNGLAGKPLSLAYGWEQALLTALTVVTDASFASPKVLAHETDASGSQP
jgi:hypothetical protein